MTTVRRFVVPLFAVCIALAVGIALGTGPLRGTAAEGGERDSDGAATDAVRSLEEAQAFSEAVAESKRQGWLDEELAGAAVTVVALPGVSAEDVRRTEETIAAAGGILAATVEVNADYVDPAKKTYVETVAETSMRSATSLSSLAGAETYEQIAALVARAYVGNAKGSDLDDEATKIASELTGAKLVTVAEPPTRRGTLSVVLAPGSHGLGAEMDARNTIVGDLVIALAAKAAGTVVVTPASGVEPGGVVDALESDPATDDLALSTLNVDEGATADAALVLALRAAADGKGAQYGVLADGDVVIPPGL